MRVICLCTEYLENSIGIDEMNPRLGWKIENNSIGILQNALLFIRRFRINLNTINKG